MNIAKQNEYQMLLNDNDEVVFPPIASKIVDIGENLFAVKIADKYGVIDTKGKTIIPFIFDDYSRFSYGLVVMEMTNEAFWVFNKDGVLIYKDSHVDNLGNFDGEFLYATNYDEDEFTHERQTNFGKVKIDSINKPLDNYDYNKKFEKIQPVEREESHYYQPSLLDL